MPLASDLHEQAIHGTHDFPIQYYIVELHKFKNHCVPLHWHPELEFFMVLNGTVHVQIQDSKIVLNRGDGIFLNTNILHAFWQDGENDVCQCPDIVFSQKLLGTGIPAIAQNYVTPIIMNKNIPYFVLTEKEGWHQTILDHLDIIFSLLHRYGERGAYESFSSLDFIHKEITSPCYEMRVQGLLNEIWQIVYENRANIPYITTEKENFMSMIRTQKMLEYIHANYKRPLTLQEITSAEVGKSEASRCFQKYVRQSPVQYLIDYRLEHAKYLLQDTTKTINQISMECGFQSASYFGKIFHKETGFAPLKYREATFSIHKTDGDNIV